MVPITLTNSSGITVASNFATIYPHTIGNPLAGGYNWTYHRWQKADTTGAPSTNGSGTQLFVADDPHTVEVQSGYGVQNGFNYRYLVTFSGGSGGTPISNLTVVINPADAKTVYDNTGITLTVAAKVVYADPINRRFKFTYGVVNGSGSARTFTDEYIHP